MYKKTILSRLRSARRRRKKAKLYRKLRRRYAHAGGI